MKIPALSIVVVALCGCAAQPPAVPSAGSPPSEPPPVYDVPPPLVTRPVPPLGAEPTLLGQRLLGMMTYFLSGTFDSGSEAKTKVDSTPVRLHSKPIWTDRKGEFWFYFEYALQADLSHPLRQRLLRFREAGGDLYADEFRLDQPARWVGEWGKSQPFASLDPSELREDPRCRLLLTKQMDALFAGGTTTDQCPGDEPGSYHRSEFLITSSEVKSWDRDFDRSGRQLSGPPGPWLFHKIAQ